MKVYCRSWFPLFWAASSPLSGHVYDKHPSIALNFSLILHVMDLWQFRTNFLSTFSQMQIGFIYCLETSCSSVAQVFRLLHINIVNPDIYTSINLPTWKDTTSQTNIEDLNKITITIKRMQSRSFVLQRKRKTKCIPQIVVSQQKSFKHIYPVIQFDSLGFH